jgi:hypothetical protein
MALIELGFATNLRYGKLQMERANKTTAVTGLHIPIITRHIIPSPSTRIRAKDRLEIN